MITHIWVHVYDHSTVQYGYYNSKLKILYFLWMIIICNNTNTNRYTVPLHLWQSWHDSKTMIYTLVVMEELLSESSSSLLTWLEESDRRQMTWWVGSLAGSFELDDKAGKGSGGFMFFTWRAYWYSGRDLVAFVKYFLYFRNLWNSFLWRCHTSHGKWSIFIKGDLPMTKRAPHANAQAWNTYGLWWSECVRQCSYMVVCNENHKKKKKWW